jgi:uncharacterized protein (DUF983 family)
MLLLYIYSLFVLPVSSLRAPLFSLLVLAVFLLVIVSINLLRIIKAYIIVLVSS